MLVTIGTEVVSELSYLWMEKLATQVPVTTYGISTNSTITFTMTHHAIPYIPLPFPPSSLPPPSRNRICKD